MAVYNALGMNKDKDNDIKAFSISKRDAAPRNMGTLFTYINLVIGMACSLPSEIRDKLYDLMGKTLDEYNELEARHQKDTGMISQYEEENRNLKSELDIKTDECDALISRVFKQDDEYTKLNEELYEVKKEREDLVKKCAELEKENTFNKKMQTEYCDIIEARLNQQYHNKFNDLKSKCESKDDALQKMIKEVAELEKEKIDLEKELKDLRKTCELLKEVNLKQCNEVDELEADIRDLEVQVQVNTSTASTYESEIKQIIDLAKSYGLIIHDDRKDAMPDDAVNIGMCGHYYVLGGRAKEESKGIQKLEKKWKKAEHTIKKLMQVLNGKNELIDELKQHYEEELRIREKEKDEKDKLIDELNSKIMMLKLSTNAMYGCYGLNSKYGELLKKIQMLEKENKELKDTIKKDGEFGKYVGKCVAESIREGWEHNLYRLHPYTRIDIHVEQITDMPFAFNHCAIPNVSVMFNNTQTEMERDTAEHECEELNKKVDTVWRANDELNRKIKALEKEKIDLEEKLKESGESSMVEIIRLKDRCTELAINRLEKEYEKLKVENNNLTTDNKRLNDAVDAWRKENKKLKEMVRSLRRTVDILNGEG